LAELLVPVEGKRSRGTVWIERGVGTNVVGHRFHRRRYGKSWKGRISAALMTQHRSNKKTHEDLWAECKTRRRGRPRRLSAKPKGPARRPRFQHLHTESIVSCHAGRQDFKRDDTCT
jgi:hypothetical protein